MPTYHSTYLYDENNSREQLIQEPSGFRTKPPGEGRLRLILSQECTGLNSRERPKNMGCLRLSIRGWRVVRFPLFLALFMFIYNPWAARAQSRPDGLTSDKSKHILVLCSYGYTLPAYQKLNPAFLAVMERAGIGTNALSFEYLDLLHSKDTLRRQDLANMLRRKYARSGIDLIITLHAPAMTFLLNEAKDIFPDVPIMSWNVQEAFKEEDGKNRIIHLSIGLDLQGTLERALDLFPQTRRVVFIIGVSEIDKYVETEAKSAFADWKNRLQFEYTSNYSIEEILKRIADLPPELNRH